MAWGTVTVGGFALRETVASSRQDQTLQVAGQESHPPSTRAFVSAVGLVLPALTGRIVPVVFTDKDELTAFYRVAQATAGQAKYHEGSFLTMDWGLSLERIGSGRDIEVESRIPLIAKAHQHGGAVTPTFWHAPAGGVLSYYTGATVPSGVLSRPSADGPISVFTGLPSAVSPRWTIEADDYMRGASRLSFDTILHLGTETPEFSVWELSNGIVKVEPAGPGQIQVTVWDPDIPGWRSTTPFTFSVNGSALTSQPDVTILWNEPEEVTLRLTYPGTPGRTTVDLTLRRGSRFVSGWVKRHSAATLAIAPATATAALALTPATAGVRRSAADADGNRWVLASSRTLTTNLSTGSISLASVTQLDFMIGFEVGTSPGTGNAAADLLNQYLGAVGERVRLVAR